MRCFAALFVGRLPHHFDIATEVLIVAPARYIGDYTVKDKALVKGGQKFPRKIGIDAPDTRPRTAVYNVGAFGVFLRRLMLD